MTTIAIVELDEATQFANLSSKQQAAMAAKRMEFTTNRMPGSRQFGPKKIVQLLFGADTTEAEIVEVVPEATVIYLATLAVDYWEIVVPLPVRYSSYMVAPSTKITHNWLGFPTL